MAQQQTPVMEQVPQAGGSTPATPKGPKKKRRGKGKMSAGILILAAVIVAVAVVLWYFVFRETNDQGEVMTGTVEYGSIQSMVEGSGMTKARNSASVTPGNGTILELYVKEGDIVFIGYETQSADSWS